MLKPDRKTTENTISVNRASPQGALIPSPELPQLHFVMKDNYHTFLLSLENILLCLREAERQGEIPPVGDNTFRTERLDMQRRLCTLENEHSGRSAFFVGKVQSGSCLQIN
ncbi:hypothetical protein [Escherichia coli]|uniref:hypothetical protein n=1 Tax=Escherichia coli TaxID=562 RepID=UPI001CBF3C9B|nr:hypothetical protein [Escherichia coli]MCQ6909735.1 hypothetical protein [Escherichia coli]